MEEVTLRNDSLKTITNDMDKKNPIMYTLKGKLLSFTLFYHRDVEREKVPDTEETYAQNQNNRE